MSETIPETTLPKKTQSSSTDSDAGSKSDVFKILIPYLVIILAQVPLLILYYKNLWETRPHYESVPLALLALGIFLYMWWPKKLKRPFFKSWFSVVLLVVGLFFAVLATIFVTPWFAAFSTICLLGSLLARTRNEETGRSLLPLVLLLLVFLQPPMGLDFDTVHGDRYVVTGLQKVSSNISSYFLDLLGYKHNLLGTVIQMPNAAAEGGVKTYSVEEACSGVQSFFTLLFFTALFIIVFKRPWFRALLLLLSAMFWALIMNTIRIMVIPIADVMFGMDLSSGAAHVFWGWVALGIGVLLVLSTDQLFVFLFGPVDEETIDDEQSSRKGFGRFWNSVISGTESRERSRKRNRPVSPIFKTALWPIAGCMALVFVVQSIDVFSSLSQPGVRVKFFDYDPTMAINEDSIPDEIGTPNNLWQKDNYEFEERVRSSDLGQRSDMWDFIAQGNYQLNADRTKDFRLRLRASFDQTFPGWHELTTCYTAQGWKFKSGNSRIRVDQSLEESGESWPFIQAEFVNATGQHGYLLFSLFDRVGEPYNAPGNWGSVNSLMLRIRNRLSHRIRSRLFHGEGYQVQVFVPSQDELPSELKEKIVENYLVFRETLRKKFEDGTIKRISEDPGSATAANEVSADGDGG